MSNENTALEAIWQPFLTGAIAWSDACLFLRARAGVVPIAIRPEKIECLQSFKPYADQLQQANWKVIDSPQKKYSIALVLASPQRDETRALFVQALQNITENGLVVVSMENNAGAKSGEKDLRQLASNVQSMSKNKCRVFWASNSNINSSLMQQWLAADQPRLVENTGFISRPGIFAWNRIDIASKLLTDNLPNSLSGRGADLGAGFGYLTHFVLQHCKKVEAMDVFEAEARALSCAKINLAQFESNTQLSYHWTDVTQGLNGPYDFVISNPPFHQGHDENQATGQAFILSAAKSLKPGGRFYMVANRHLAYEASLHSVFSHVTVLASHEGYKIFEAVK